MKDSSANQQKGMRRTMPMRLIALPIVAGAVLAAPLLFGQYAITSYTIDGGGGTSTGGVYTVSGTIGQPDAGPTMTGGPYALTGAFWSIFAVQTPGAPLLTIFRTPTNTAVVSWPSPSTGWNLQQNDSLSTTNWITPPENVQDDGTNRFIVVTPPQGNRFYRLFKP
ncbi:MAG TPA: hypothetical protein GYA07_05145 [Verrucomicrobia bacterium]|nr:hypothetical protein [Verrucomicrobiota bacterium]HOP98809.1 hypothetical protein [Verrucomicrobiota bacterium]HPU55703.1 hypothetical protein [Verrucomicrobiota bacterium]